MKRSQSSPPPPMSAPATRKTSLRPLACELSCLQNSDGSALFQSGSTHVLASVHGPLAPRIRQHEDSTQASISIILKSPRSSTTTAYDREWENFLTGVLSSCIRKTAYPRSVIQIVLQIVAADGSVLSTCLHAAVAALMDAGIEMLRLPTAATCLLHSDGPDYPLTVQLDPSSDQEQASSSHGCIVVVTVPSTNKVLATHTMIRGQGSKGGCSIETLLQCCALSSRAGPAVVAFLRLAFEQKVQKEAQTLWSST